MRIKKIEIQNFRAIYGNFEIELGGKNLLLYGENGIRALECEIDGLVYELYELTEDEHNNRRKLRRTPCK